MINNNIGDAPDKLNCEEDRELEPSDGLIGDNNSSLNQLEEKVCSGDIVPYNATISEIIKKSNQIALNISQARLKLSQLYINIQPRITQSIKVVNNILTNLKIWQENYTDIALKISSSFSPIYQLIESIDFTPLYEFIKKCANISIDLDKIKKRFLDELFLAHWFPYVILIADFSLAIDIFEVISHTRQSKNRIKRIDKTIFDYYTNDKVERLKKDWRKLDLPEYFMRILHQAVQAYHRKEYALTVIVLAMQWEGIINNKANNQGRRKAKETKNNLNMLIKDNDCSEILQSFYDDLIMYNCNSSADIIDDVPGRNGIAHSFYNRYPTKKAALNAILFTDFLLHLQPLEEELNDGQNENGIC